MDFTGLRSEIKRMTGQRTGWVGDKQPINYSPPRSHWQMRKDLQAKFLKINKRGKK